MKGRGEGRVDSIRESRVREEWEVGTCGKWRAALTLGGDRTEGNGGLNILTGSVYGHQHFADSGEGLRPRPVQDTRSW